MKKVVLFIITLLCLTSCGTAKFEADVFKSGKVILISDYKVFQTLDRNFGLASNPYNGMVIAIKSSNKFYPIYDGEVIKGMVIMTGTYTYETVEKRNKTIPIVVPYNEFKEK